MKGILSTNLIKYGRSPLVLFCGTQLAVLGGIAWWPGFSWLWRSDGTSPQLLSAAEYSTIVLTTGRSTLLWTKCKYMALSLLQQEWGLNSDILFSAQRYSKAACYLKKFLRQMFKVFHCLMQTDVSSFHSYFNLRPQELARPGCSPFRDQALVFLPSCLFVCSNLCLSSFFMLSSPSPPWYIQILLLIRASI